MPRRANLTDSSTVPPPLFSAASLLPRAAAGVRCVSLLQLYRASAKAQSIIWRTFGGDLAAVTSRTAPLITSFAATVLHVVSTKTRARRLTLGMVVGGVACPFKLMTLLRAGCEGAIVRESFRNAMLAELGRAYSAHTIQERQLLIECIRTLRSYFPEDSAVADLIMTEPALRHREECTYLRAQCAPSSLAVWYRVPDFRRAAQAVHDAGCGPFKLLLGNAALSVTNLLDCFTVLVRSGRARGWFTRGVPHCSPDARDSGVPQRAALKVLAGNWLTLYESWHAPVGRLWVASCADPTLWLPILSEALHSGRSLSSALPNVEGALHTWPHAACQMASVLLASSRNPETAALGRALSDYTDGPIDSPYVIN